MIAGPQGLITLTEFAGIGCHRPAPGIDIDAAEVLTNFTDTVAEYLARLRLSHNRY